MGHFAVQDAPIYYANSTIIPFQRVVLLKKCLHLYQ